MDTEQAVRAALAAPENDPATHGYRVPEAVLRAVRGRETVPPPGAAALCLVHAVAAADAAAIAARLHADHAALGPVLVRTAVAEVRALGEEHTALECAAFAHYELGEAAVPVALPAGLDFAAWAGGARAAHARVSAAGYARAARESPDPAAELATGTEPRGFLAARPWLIELVLAQSADSRAAIDAWWGTVVPALLNALDTPDAAAKARSVRLVMLLVHRFGARLQLTGLVPVFEDAVEPSLSFLPPLEAPARTMLVFGPAVRCLGALAQLAPDAGARAARTHFLAREGCLKAFLHAYENVELLIYFFDTLRAFIDDCAQSLTVVHLSGIVRVFTQTTTDPFVTASPPLVDAAGRAMAAAVRWGWPRIAAYKYTILLGLAKSGTLDSECAVLLDVSAGERAQLEAAVHANEAAAREAETALAV